VHRALGVQVSGLRESLEWFGAHLREEGGPTRRMPVRVFVLGWQRWVDLADWPPVATPVEWYLQPGGRLAPTAAGDCAPDAYVYDPAQPTPTVGGPLLAARRAVYDNRRLEARADVLTYTSDVLERDVVLMGAIEVELHVSSSRPTADFFARVCDVEPGGRSLNVTDGIVRLTGQTWPTCTRIRLSETAYCFRRGHRVRLQVSSGSFPRFSRNTGSGEPLGEAATLCAAHQRVLHDAEHRSLVRMPVHGGH
jgi:hypothetical protein